MCECLEHSDGTITLCAVCADTWREYESVVIPRLRLLEAVREAAESLCSGQIAWEELRAAIARWKETKP